MIFTQIIAFICFYVYFCSNVADVRNISNFTFKVLQMENKGNRTTNLIEALKEYNKSLSEQITRIKSFINEIDKQINSHQEAKPSDSDHQKIEVPFSKDYLIYKSKKNMN